MNGMKVATFYPSYYEELTVHTYESAKEIVDEGVSVRTTQMCMLNHVKDYDLIRIVEGPDNIIEIVNNHDGSYSCDRTDRTLRRANSFFHLWENGEFRRDKDVNDANDNSDGCNRNHHCCDQHQVSYDELVNERHKAVCELRNVQMDTGNAIKKLAVALGLEWNPNNAPKSVALLQSRIIHLLGGDECNFSGVESYMDAMGGKSNPAETSNESIDHVTLATPSSEDETCPNPVRDASIIDKLDNERHKAIAGLRKVCTKLDESVWTWIEDVAIAIGAQDKQSDKYESMLPEITDRLIHLLGGDQPMLSDLYGIWQDGEESENKDSELAHKMTKSAEIAKLESEDGGEVTITDELRKFKCHIDAGLTPETVLAIRAEINAIADRIDAQFDRICEQNEAVLQQTINSMCEEQDRLQERLRAAELGCDANHRLAEANAGWCDDLVDLLRDASREYKDRHYWKQVWHDRAVDLRMERDELQEKCDRLKAKVEHQREQLAVYATMYDFDAIRALKRERNEHKHRADNAEGHVKSLERRLDAAHETYCALLNDAAREFRALTEERDELRRSLRQIAERAGVPHDWNLSEYGDKKIANAVIGQLGETKQYVKSLEWVRDRRLPRIEAKRDELLAKLDDYDRTHVELPKDANGDHWHIGDESEYGEVTGILYNNARTLIEVRMGNGERAAFGASLGRKANPVTVEQVIRDLTLGKITEAQAIERIEGINGQC